MQGVVSVPTRHLEGYRPEVVRECIAGAAPLQRAQVLTMIHLDPNRASVESSSSPSTGHPGITMDILERYAAARQHTAAAVEFWLRRSSLTHAKASALSGWVCGGDTCLQTSQLSFLRNAKAAFPQFKLMEGLATATEACWRWKTQGPEACRKLWGPMPRQLSPAVMDGTVFLWHPDHPEGTEPLRFADWCELFAGYLRLPYVDAEDRITAANAQQVSDQIGRYLEQWLLASGLGLRGGFAELVRLYPDTDPRRIEKLRQVVSGLASFDADELEDGRLALSELLSRCSGEAIAPEAMPSWLAANSGRTGARH